MSEMTDKVKGKANEVKGAVTGDTSTEMKGKGQQTVGDAKGKLDDAKDAVHDSSDDTSDNR